MIAPGYPRAEGVGHDVQAEWLCRDGALMRHAEIAHQSEPTIQIVGNGSAATIHIESCAADHNVRVHIGVTAEDFPLGRVLRVGGLS